MRTREDVLAAIQAGRASQCLDGRDYVRLAEFFPVEAFPALGVGLKSGVDPQTWRPKPWTPEAVIAQLQEDVAFGFSKALDRRGISAGLMYEVVRLWLWILEDPLQELEEYAEYGLPLFKAVAVKYGFPNPIGEDAGNEPKYSMEGLAEA